MNLETRSSLRNAYSFCFSVSTVHRSSSRQAKPIVMSTARTSSTSGSGRLSGRYRARRRSTPFLFLDRAGGLFYFSPKPDCSSFWRKLAILLLSRNRNDFVYVKESLVATLGTADHDPASAFVVGTFADSLNTFSTFTTPSHDRVHDRHRMDF